MTQHASARTAPGASTQETSAAAELALEPIAMEQAVGYPAIDCQQTSAPGSAIVLKHDRLFLILDEHGNVAPPGNCGLGLFQDDTRMLSAYVLRMAGGSPTPLSSQAFRMHSAQIDLALRDTAFGGDSWNVNHAVHVRRELLLDDRFTERVTFTSFLRHPVDFWAELALGCDFADIFEVRGWRRQRRGQFYAPAVAGNIITFLYRGVDGRLMESAICFQTPPARLDARGARWTVRLEPHAPWVLEWQVIPGANDAPAPEPVERRRCAASPLSIAERREPTEARYEDWRARCTHFTSGDATFSAALAQAVTDLRALYTDVEGLPILTAGIPWYSTAFGRDSIIASLQALMLTPAIARDTLRFLARYQGARVNPSTEEQPGRIMHELRRGEMARAGEIPFTPYYGTVDATPLWLMLFVETWRWTGDLALVRELLPNAERALAWIDTYGDLDGDGFVEYAKTSPQGLVNQGWKDSWDGVPFPDGRLPEPPVALVEVQGYVYDAKQRMAALYRALGDDARAESLHAEARALRQRIIDGFWLPELGTFALALDGRKQPLPTVSSNAGHLLWCRVPDAERARRTAETLLAPPMFSGWGVRTLSAAHPVYNPMSYHDGSVWPHDNAIIALGFAHCGLPDMVPPIVTGLYEAARGLRYERLPELFCGMTRGHGHQPVLYPVSCSPQAWASGALFMMLQAVTGLLPDAPDGVLHIREPRLPPWLSELSLRGLAIGDSSVSLQFTRHGDRTLANVLAVEGAPLRVVVELR